MVESKKLEKAKVKIKMSEQPVILNAITSFLKEKGVGNLNVKEL